MTSSYTYEAFKPIIKSINPRTVAEVGSMHGLDTIELIKEYNPEKIIVVECNPEGIELCRKNLKPYNQVTLVENAAWNAETTLSFYKVVESRDMYGNVSHSNDMHKCNIGASSCFKTNNKWPFEYYRQEEIKVKARRLEDILKDNNVNCVDLICMDVQGAALQVMEGAGDYLKNVKAIITELEIEPIYHDQTLLRDVEPYLNQYGFKIAAVNNWSDLSRDFLFVNTNFS